MRIITGIFLLAIICFGGSSCQKDFTPSEADSTTTTTPGANGSFTAKIDGASFVANKAAQASRSLALISIAGQSTDGQTIVFTVADSGVHVYSLDINSMNAAAYTIDSNYAYTTNQGNSSLQSGGTLSITSIDTVKKTMSGTFSMKMFRALDQSQKNITEGVFTNIPYTTQALPPSNSGDTFRVKIDGAQFAVYSTIGISTFGMLSVSASDQSVNKTVGITMPSDIVPGSFTFTAFGPSYIGQYNIGTSYLVAGSGTLTILEHNTVTKRIRGNFNFDASEIPGIGTKTAKLTEGYFSLVYQ